MRWVAPTEKDTANETLEKRLWAAADQFRANSGLKAAQYSAPVLGLIFEKADLLVPPAPLLKKFGEATIPMAEQIHTLQRQIQNLRRTHAH